MQNKLKSQLTVQIVLESGFWLLAFRFFNSFQPKANGERPGWHLALGFWLFAFLSFQPKAKGEMPNASLSQSHHTD